LAEKNNDHGRKNRCCADQLPTAHTNKITGKYDKTVTAFFPAATGKNLPA